MGFASLYPSYVLRYQLAKFHVVTSQPEMSAIRL